jgi:hypothetical protein
MTLTCRGEATQTPSRHATIVPLCRTPLVSLAALSLAVYAMAQAPASGQRVRRLLIHNAIVIDGNGTPASGPKDPDPYARYHPAWTAIDGLRDYRWPQVLPCPVF